MDAIFDVSFVVPAVIFTFLAIILATSLFGKKADPKSETIVDDAPLEDTAREGEELQPKSEKHKVSQSEVNRIEEITAEPEPDVPAVAPVVEEMGALEEEPVTQSEIPPAQQESEKKQIMVRNGWGCIIKVKHNFRFSEVVCRFWLITHNL